MLYQEGAARDFGLYESSDLDARVLEIPYSHGSNMGFYIILPNAVDGKVLFFHIP